MRGYYFIPDDDDGRAALMAMLRCGLSVEEALEGIARWMEPAEAKRLARRAAKIKLHDIGKLVKLTEAERQHGKLWLLRPYDIPWPEVRRRQRKRRAEAERERKRKERREQREAKVDRIIATKYAATRAEALRHMLAGRGWCPVPALIEDAKRCEAFRTARGHSLKRSSLRKIVHRELDRLEDEGKIESDLRPGDRSPVRFVRFNFATRNAAKNKCDSLTAGVEAKTDAASRTSAEKLASMSASADQSLRADSGHVRA
jgi:hypothetical protein